MWYIRFICCFIFMGISLLSNDIPLVIQLKSNNNNFSGPPFVIGFRKAGFFSNFLGTIQNMLWAKNNNRTPIIYWDHSSYYYDPTITHTQNVWEYYFEPVSTLTYQSGDPIWMNFADPNGTQLPYGRKTPYYFDKNIRKNMHQFITQHIHVKKHIKKKVERFVTNFMGTVPTIGIHLRGTDKQKEAKPINPHIIFNKANNLANELGACQFLVATDEESLLRLALEKLNRTVVYYDAHRSTDGKPVHTNCFQYKIGEDVLIEALLLSRCDYFIHTRSNVSIGVCILNPELPNIYFEN